MAVPAAKKLAAFVVLVLALELPQPSWSQQPPPNYSYDALPDTSFSCEGRVVGGYYADVEAGCQMFHVCGTSQRTSFRFLCPNNTVFDQQHLICANWFQVICDRSAVLYARNFEIFKTGAELEQNFNAIDEDDLPPLDDYDYDFRPNSGGVGRFFGGGKGSQSGTGTPVTRPAVTRRPVARPAVTRAPVTRPAVSRAPVTRPAVSRAPVTRSDGTRAPSFRTPRRFDQTTAATTPRPALSAVAATTPSGASTLRVFSTEPPRQPPARPFSFRPTPLPPPSAAPGANSSPAGPFRTSAGTSAAPTRTVRPRVTASRLPESTSPRAGAAAAGPTSFTTPRPVFTTTGSFPFGFTSVPQATFAFGNGGSFSFGTAVDSRAGPSSRPDEPQDNEVPREAAGAGRTGTTPRPAAARPATPSPQRALAVSSAAPFVRGPSARPAESSGAVSAVAGRFFGANVLPEAAPPSGRPGPSGRGRDSFRLSGGGGRPAGDALDADDDANAIFDDDAFGEVTTAAPDGRFSATVPTRSPSTRLSADSGAVTTFLPRTSGGGPRNFRRRRPPIPAATSAASGRGSRRRGGAVRRRRPSTAPSAGPGPAAARPSPRPTAAPTSPRPVTRASTRPPAPRPRPSAAPVSEFSNEIDSAPAATRRPQPRGRGNRRFNPLLPGGDLNPVQYVRAGASRSRAPRPTAPAGTARPRLIDAEVDALAEELNLLEDAERQAERRFTGAEANNRSIDDGPRVRQRVAAARATTAAPLLRRVTPAARRPTAAPATASTPQIIRKRIRVRGRPSRRPTSTTAAPPTTTSAPPAEEASTLPTNKEASSLGRQNGFFLRPKLQLSSALPRDAKTRRLNDVNSVAAERTGRSRNTSPIAFNRVVRSTTRAPAPDARLSDILFASSSPGGARPAAAADSDYDYEYYDTDFRLEHQQLIDETDTLFQSLSRKTRWT